MTEKDSRLALLMGWITTLTDFSLQPATLRAASSDASFRRYFRLEDANGKSYIVMDAPQPQEDVRPFIHIAQLFADAGVTVPRIFASDIAQGFLLLNDLGSVMYSDLLAQEAVAKGSGGSRFVSRSG